MFLVVALLAVFSQSASAVEVTQASMVQPEPPAAVFLLGEWSDAPSTASMVPFGEEGRARFDLPDGEYGYLLVVRNAEGNLEPPFVDPGNPYFRVDEEGTIWSLLAVCGNKTAAPDRSGMEEFRVGGGEFSYVNLTGSFNGWRQGNLHLQRDADGSWYAFGRLARPFQYKFILDDQWFPDPDVRNPRVLDGFGGENSLRPTEGFDPGAGDGARSAGSRAKDSAPSAELLARVEADGVMGVLQDARALARRGKYREAVALCQSVRDCAASSARSGAALEDEAQALWELSMIYNEYGQIDQAIASWQTIWSQAPDCPVRRDAGSWLAKRLMHERGDFEGARAIYQQMLGAAETDLERAAALFLQGISYFYENRDAEAIISLRDALAAAAIAPVGDNDYAAFLVEVHTYLGQALMRSGELDEAAAAFREAIAASPWPNSQDVRLAQRRLNEIENEPAQ